jgi:hypothetical protein
MKDAYNFLPANSPLRSSDHSPLPSAVSKNKHLPLRTTGLNTLKSKRNSQVDCSKDLDQRSSVSKSLARASKASNLSHVSKVSIITKESDFSNHSEILIPVKPLRASSVIDSSSSACGPYPDRLARNSEESPDWFRIPVPSCKQNNDDGRISVLSKLNGWIFISEKSKNRKNRAGKKGPFEGPGFDVHQVSALAPSWMLAKKNSFEESKSRDLSPAYSSMTKEEKRLFLFEGSGDEKGKSNDNTPKVLKGVERVNRVSYRPRIFYEWVAPVNEGKVTGKVGSFM